MALDAGVVAAVLLAGLLHAVWNTLVKVGADRLTTLTLVMGASALPWLPVAVLLPLPAPASWPFIAASTAAQLAYMGLLLGAYRHGDLSQVYPIARGAAPALVAAGAWLFAGEALSVPEVLGIAVVCVGIFSLARRPGGFGDGEAKAVGFALLAAVSIATYIVIDGMGVRRAGGAFSYIAWLFIVQGLVLSAVGAWLRRGRLGPVLRENWARGLLGGLLASLSYGVAIWAMSLGPMAHITALRETSVLMAAIIGARILKEPLGARRMAAAGTVACGAVLLQAAGG